MANSTPTTAARGGGIGPAVRDSTLLILNQAGGPIEIEPIHVGEQVYSVASRWLLNGQPEPSLGAG